MVFNVLRQAAAVLALGLAANAFPCVGNAGEVVYHPGACVGSGAPLSYGRFYAANYAGYRQGAYCPLQHDPSYLNQSFRMMVYDRHSSEAVECRYYTYGTWGPIQATGGTGRYTLDLGTYSRPWSWTSSPVAYCTLPDGGSRVENVYFEEF